MQRLARSERREILRDRDTGCFAEGIHLIEFVSGSITADGVQDRR